MSLVGTASPTSKTLKKRCSSASRRISRSGLIRELNETRANCSGSARPKQLWQLERDYDLRDRLCHVEARRVGASEFRRVYSETRRLSVCHLSAQVGRRRAEAP